MPDVRPMFPNRSQRCSAEPDESGFDQLSAQALSAVADRFERASATVQDLFDSYTAQARRILDEAGDPPEGPVSGRDEDGAGAESGTELPEP